MSVGLKQATKIAANMFMMACDGKDGEMVCYPLGYLEDGEADARQEMSVLFHHYMVEGKELRNKRLTTLIKLMEITDKVDVVVLWNDSQHDRYWAD